jgi:hypothetical protein
VATGVTVVWVTRRVSVADDKLFAVCAMAYTIGVFAVFWLGIAHLPLALGIQAGELGDGLAAAGALVYLAHQARADPSVPGGA